MHITKLLRLGLIRKSISSHKSPAFIVNKYNEQVRGRSRMVIDNKRLNNSTIDDGYDIPDKSELINSIQESSVFCKFDCKSRFWDINIHPYSIEWTAFTCSLGHYEWLVMPFGLKNAPSNSKGKWMKCLENIENLYAYT